MPAMVVMATAITSMAAVPTAASSSVVTTARPVGDTGTQQPSLARPQKAFWKGHQQSGRGRCTDTGKGRFVTAESPPGLLAFVTMLSGS